MRTRQVAAAVPAASIYNNNNILAAYHRHCKLPGEDSKAFVDRPLIGKPDTILEAFRVLSPSSPKIDFEKFFEKYFAPDPDAGALPCTPEDFNPLPPKYTKDPKFPETARKFAEHLKPVWADLCRQTPKESIDAPIDSSSLIPLPHPFFIPGGRFRECYYWDTYWVVKGLLSCDMRTSAKHCAENLLSLVNKFGFVPNGNRVYYLNRSQPPTLAITVQAILDDAQEPDLEWLSKCIDTLDIEYENFIANHNPKHTQNDKTAPLCVYKADTNRPRPESWIEDAHTAANFLKTSVDLAAGYPKAPAIYANLAAGAESGWDFSTRWFASPEAGILSINTSDIIPVCLNSILVATERTLARFHTLLGHNAEAERYSRAVKARVTAINEVLWNPDKKIWCDFNGKRYESTGRLAASGLFPLWAQCWPESWTFEEAKAFVNFFENDSGLLVPGGVAATLFDGGKEQWDYPNAWPPLVDFAVTGFENLEAAFPGCGAGQLARSIAERMLRTMYTGWSVDHAMHEKYDGSRVDGARGVGGEYEPQVGFGWTNGVALDFMKRLYWPSDLR